MRGFHPSCFRGTKNIITIEKVNTEALELPSDVSLGISVSINICSEVITSSDDVAVEFSLVYKLYIQSYRQRLPFICGK